MSSVQRNTRPNIFKRFGQYIVQLNLYSDTESLVISEQLMSTRLYLMLLAISICILLTFAGLTIPARTTLVTSPSLQLFDYLSNRYPSTFSCACSQSVIPYDAFLSFAPRYHQICSSVFVSQSWISTLFSFQMTHYYPLDFRTGASSQFQVIASLCRFAAQSIDDSVKTLSMNQLITVSALSRVAFDSQSETFVQQLETATVADASLIDEYVAFIIAQNYITSALRMNTYFITTTNTTDSYSAQYLWDENLPGPSIADFCFCYQTYTCSPKARFYNLTLPYNYASSYRPSQSLLHVSGIKAGCVPHDSILNSTLECFYNATCIEMLIEFMGGITFPDPLDDTVQSRFNSNMTISSMFAELFIEEWNYTSNFTGYFATCAPVSCSYSYAERINAAYMIITFLGFIGGMTVVLGFIAPFLVKDVVHRMKRKCCAQNHQEQQTQMSNDEAATRSNRRKHLAKIAYKAVEMLVKLKLFKTSFGVQQDIWSTRVYLFLLTSSSVILAIYNSVTLHTITVTVQNPSWANFQQMYAEYSPELSCPCTNISVPYGSFMTIQPRFHQVCSSDFVKTDRWLTYFLFINNLNITTHPKILSYWFDFRIRGYSNFYFLSTLCQVANETVTNAIATFNKTEFISVEPMSEAYFHAQTSFLLEQFEEHSRGSFLTLFTLVRSMISDNQLLNGAKTNYYSTIVQANNSSILMYSTTSYQNDNTNCSCSTDTTCTHKLGIYCELVTCFDASKPFMIIPGLIIGCLPVDSVLLSTLECFYNQSCVQMLIDLRTIEWYMFLPFTLNITALDPNLPSRFSPKTQLNTIVSQLLIEEWINMTYPRNHYEQCKPSTCTYTYTGRYNTFYVITIVLGLLGGLNVVLRLIIPFIIKLIVKLKHRLLRRLNQAQEQSSTGLSPSDRIVDEEYPQNRIQFLMMYSRRALISLNMFDNEVDQLVLPTIVYLLLVGVSFAIVLIFVVLGQETRSYTIVSPSESTFELLHEQYEANSLSCPCTQISMPYHTFLTLSTFYHQVCSSDFISPDWRTLVWSTGDTLQLKDQPLLSTYFRMLSSMCTLSEETVKNSTDTFLSSVFISIETLRRDLFESQVQSSVNGIIQQTPMTFRRTVQFARESFRANQLEDIFMSSWKPVLTTTLENYIEARIPLSFNNETCICATSMLSLCWRPLVFMMNNSTNNISSTITLPGLIGGCLPIEGLRMSTLECFYDSICLDTLGELVNNTRVPDQLNTSVSTRFPHTTTTIGSMIDELFIEQWFNTSNYSSYYQMCSPRTCYYKRVEHNSLVYIITYLLGLYGGLTIIVRLVVRGGLRLFRYMRSTRIGNPRQMMRVTPLN